MTPDCSILLTVDRHGTRIPGKTGQAIARMTSLKENGRPGGIQPRDLSMAIGPSVGKSANSPYGSGGHPMWPRLFSIYSGIVSCLSLRISSMAMPDTRVKKSPLLASLALCIAAAWLEIHTDNGLRFGPMYVIPAAIMGWFHSRNAGIISAIVMIFTWQTLAVRQIGSGLPVLDHVLNLFVRLASLASVTLGASWARSSLELQKSLSRELCAALGKVQVLEGLLPICAWRKKVRNDSGTWEQIDAYVSEYSNATWTQGICPEYKQKLRLEGTRATKDRDTGA